jgi:cyanophycinase
MTPVTFSSVRRLACAPVRPLVIVSVLAGLLLSARGPAEGQSATRGGVMSPGSLVLIGGGSPVDDSLFRKVIELAGGPDAPLVMIPTAGGATSYDASFRGLAQLRQAGARNVQLLHTLDRRVADTEAFVAPLKSARGVFIFGGTNAYLADAYLHTRTHEALQDVLRRGGVLAGSSAGAEVQGTFMPRGQTGDENGTVLIGDHTEGFGFLPGTAIDAHVLVLNRHFDMREILRRDPSLLGIGLDEQTAIVVQGTTFEVMGRSYVAIYDATRRLAPDGDFYFLKAGDRFNLQTREPSRPGAPTPPFSRLQPAHQP